MSKKTLDNTQVLAYYIIARGVMPLNPKVVTSEMGGRNAHDIWP